MTTTIATARTDMSLNVPPEFERAIRERVESGAYASEADVFAACLEALDQGEDDTRRAIEEGVRSADTEPLIPGDDVVALMHAIARGERPGESDEKTSGTGAERPGIDARMIIPREFERVIIGLLENGAYRSSDDAFRASIDALTSWEHEQTAKLEALRTEIRVGVEQLERGQVVDGHQAFARARARLLEKARARDALHPR